MGRRLRLAATAILLVAGCLDARHFPAPDLPPSARLVSADPSPAISPLSTADPKPKTLIAFSGGGLYGAYAAGVLKGWTASGQRPNFDTVTGISTGALIASLAFLGPDCDGLFEEWYTTATPDGVYHRHSLAALLWSESLADSEPLRKRIEAFVTPELLVRIAAECRTGRRLYFGTTELDSGAAVVWDMGAIADSKSPAKLDLFRRVTLASCSVPGLMPPVAIDVEVDGRRHTELHVDGGVSTTVFVPPAALDAAGMVQGSVVYAIVSGKVAIRGHEVSRRMFDVAGASLESVIRAQTRGDLAVIASQARQASARFGYAAVPEDFGTSTNSLGLTPKALREMFDEGVRFGHHSREWQTDPSRLTAGGQPPPRTGTRLATFPNSPSTDDVKR